jgi:hypothetical protein
MADDRWTTWQAESAGTHRGPKITTVFFWFTVLTFVLLHYMGGYDAVYEQANHGKPASLCAEHHGRPGWDAVCKERPGR